MIKLKELASVFFPLLLSFLASRLLTQTDLIMVSHMGIDSLAAFAIPVRLMIFDIMAAMSVIPIISVTVSKASAQRRGEVIQKSIGLCALISLSLMSIGLIVYPVLLDLFPSEVGILDIARPALFWLTVAIPFRFMKSIFSIVLHARGYGYRVVRLAVFEVLSNIVANLVCIYVLQMGFVGVFISTFFVSGLACAISGFWVMRMQTWQAQWLDWSWMKGFLQKSIAEWGRLLSERSVLLVLLATFSTHGVVSMAVYSVVIEWESLLFVPLIALMRSIGIYFPQHYRADQVGTFLRDFSKVIVWGFGSLFAFGCIVLMSSDFIGESIYNISAESMPWWSGYLMIFCIYLPVRFASNLAKGLGFATENFSKVAIYDVGISWGVTLPIVIIGLYWNWPVLVWSGFLIAEVLILGLVMRSLTGQTIKSLLKAHPDQCRGSGAR